MSYCRFGDTSDVYVYFSVEGVYVCCACHLAEEPFSNFGCATPDEMIVHLDEHERVGHQVPQHAIDRLMRDVDEEALNCGDCE